MKNRNLNLEVHHVTRVEGHGNIYVNVQDGKIEKFLEKPSWGEVFSDTINTGIYIIEPEILDLMEEEVFNFENYLYPVLLKNKIRFYGYNTNEFIHDMGTVERLKKCEDYLRNKSKLDYI